MPVSATAKFAPLTPTRADEEPLAQVAPGRLGELRGVVAQVPRVVERAPEQLADLRAVAVDRGHEDVGLLVVAELDDELREIGLLRA